MTPQKRPRWTPEELEFLHRWYPTIENTRIAASLGRSHSSIMTKAHRLGLKKDPELLRLIASDNVSRRYEGRLAG